MVERTFNSRRAEDQAWDDTMRKACKTGNLDVVANMIQLGFDVNYCTYGRMCEEDPLFVASGNGQVDVVKFLLDNGALIDNKYLLYEECYRITALDEAVLRNQLGVAKILLDRNASHSYAMKFVIIRRSHEMAKLLIEHGVDTDVMFYHYFSNHGFYSLTFLLEAGAKVPQDIQRHLKGASKTMVDLVMSKSMENINLT